MYDIHIQHHHKRSIFCIIFLFENILFWINIKIAMSLVIIYFTSLMSLDGSNTFILNVSIYYFVEWFSSLVFYIVLQNHDLFHGASCKWRSIYRLICWNLCNERHRLGGITLISCPPPERRSVQFLCGFHALKICSCHSYQVFSSLIVAFPFWSDLYGKDYNLK